MILSMIILVLSLSVQVLRNDLYSNYLDTANKDNIQYTTLLKDIYYKKENQLESKKSNYTRNDINHLMSLTNDRILFAVTNPVYPKDVSNDQEISNEMLFEHSQTMPINNDFLKSNNFKLIYGKAPSQANEVVISLYYADLILTYGKEYLNGVSDYQGLVDSDLVDLIFKDIVGIVDTNLRLEDVLKESSDLVPLFDVDNIHVTKFVCQSCVIDINYAPYISDNSIDDVDLTVSGSYSKSYLRPTVYKYSYISTLPNNQNPLYDDLNQADTFAVINIGMLDGDSKHRLRNAVFFVKT